MASVFTQSISIDSTSEPSQYYNLMSINELKSDCLKTLHSTNPCAAASAIMFRAGSTDIPQQLEMISSSSAAATIGDTFYFTVPAGPVGAPSALANLQAYKYNVSSGVLTQGILGFSQSFKYPGNKYYFERSSVAINRHGDGLFLAYSGGEYQLTFFNGEFAYLSGLQGDSVLLTNDNHHTVYTLVSDASTNQPGVYTHQLSYYTVTVSTIDPTPQSYLQPLLSFQTYNNATVLQMGIYCTFPPSDNTSPPPIESIFLYYMVGTEDSYAADLYVLNSGVSSLLFVSSEAFHVTLIMTFQISAWENKVFVMYQNETTVHGPNNAEINRIFTHVASIDYKGSIKHCSTIYSGEGFNTFPLV